MISVGFSKKRGNRDGKRGRYTKVNLEHNHTLTPLNEVNLGDSRTAGPSTSRISTSSISSARAQSSRSGAGGSISVTANPQLPRASTSSSRTTTSRGKNSSNRATTARSTVESSDSLADYGGADFPQSPMISTEHGATMSSVPELQSSRSNVVPLPEDVITTFRPDGSSVHRPPQNVSRGDVTWDELRAQMNHIPWSLHQDVMKAFMEVVRLTQQSFQVPNIVGHRTTDADAVAAIANAGLPTDYNPNVPQSHQPPELQPLPQQQPQQQQQHQASSSQQQRQQQQTQQSFVHHHNLSTAGAGPSAMEGMSNGLTAGNSTSSLLQLHRADIPGLNVGRISDGIQEKGHSRQSSNAEVPVSMIPNQPSTIQVSTAIPTVMSSVPPSVTHVIAATSSATTPSTPTTSHPMAAAASPQLTSQPSAQNAGIAHVPMSGDPAMHHPQSSFVHHSRQSSHTGTGHHRSLSASSTNMGVGGGTGIHGLEPNGSLIAVNNAQSNGSSSNGNLESSPLLPQVMAEAVRTHAQSVQTHLQVQAHLQAQVDADAEVVNAALNMNPLSGPSPVAGTPGTNGSPAFQTLNILDETVRIHNLGMGPTFPPQLHQQSHQGQPQPHVQQQAHARSAEESAEGNDLSTEPARKRRKA